MQVLSVSKRIGWRTAHMIKTTFVTETEYEEKVLSLVESLDYAGEKRPEGFMKKMFD